MSGLTTVLIILACCAAIAGVVLLSPATQGVGVLAIACLLAIFARIAQAGAHAGKPGPNEATAARGGIINPPSQGPWPPAIGEQLALASSLDLREGPDRKTKRRGFIPSRTRFAVVKLQDGWMFVQTEDGRTEGWIELGTWTPNRV